MVVEQESIWAIVLVHFVMKLDAVDAERVLAREDLGIAKHLRAERTDQKLAVEFVGKAGPLRGGRRFPVGDDDDGVRPIGAGRQFQTGHVVGWPLRLPVERIRKRNL